MGISRTRSIQSIQHQCLSHCVGQMFLCTDDSGDAHGSIIHRDTKIVNRDTTTAHKNKITHRRLSIPADGSPNHIVDNNASVIGNLESNCKGLVFVQHFFNQSWIGISPTAVVTRGLASSLLFGLHFLQFLGSAKTPVSFTFLQKTRNSIIINSSTLRLTVWAVGSIFNVRAFVSVQPQPLQISHDGILRFFCRSRHISIFHTQHKGGISSRKVELSFLGNKPVVQRGSGPSNVQTTRWTGGKSHARWFIFCLFAFQWKSCWQNRRLFFRVAGQHKATPTESRVSVSVLFDEINSCRSRKRFSFSTEARRFDGLLPSGESPES
mmetsp:Transcript_22487/g.62414  ORF Transcript_22487/g.62414 Transcript_22487/m.62414 type:complete len:323 (-) Transcript_22487:286-1254(-)